MKKETVYLLQRTAVTGLSAIIAVLLWMFIPTAEGNRIFNFILAGIATLLLIGYAVFFWLRKETEKTRTTRALILLTAALAILVYYNFIV